MSEIQPQPDNQALFNEAATLLLHQQRTADDAVELLMQNGYDRQAANDTVANVAAQIAAAKKDEERFGPRGEQPDATRFQLARFYLTWFQKIFNDPIKQWWRNVCKNFFLITCIN